MRLVLNYLILKILLKIHFYFKCADLSPKVLIRHCVYFYQLTYVRLNPLHCWLSMDGIGICSLMVEMLLM